MMPKCLDHDQSTLPGTPSPVLCEVQVPQRRARAGAGYRSVLGRELRSCSSASRPGGAARAGWGLHFAAAREFPSTCSSLGPSVRKCCQSFQLIHTPYPRKAKSIPTQRALCRNIAHRDCAFRNLEKH